MGIGGSKFDPATDLLDLKGKVVIVTGGNRGIGYQTVKHLARRGAKVYLGARSESSATDAIAKIRVEGLEPGNGEIIWLKVDLGNPRLAKQAAEDFLIKEKRLDILVNNAGGMTHKGERTPDGISQMAVVNYISPFVFTRTLIPLLVETARQSDSDVRIVNVATTVHKMTPSASTVRWRTKEDFNTDYSRRPLTNLLGYAHSKFPLIPWTFALQRRFDADNVPITCISLHPGAVDTFSHNFPLRAITSPPMRLILYTPEQGCYTSLFAAASPAVAKERNKYKGAYLEPVGKIAEPLKETKNQELGEELWMTTEEVLKEM